MKLIIFSHFSDKFKTNKHFAPPSPDMLEQTIALAVKFTGINTSGGIVFHDDDWAGPARHVDYSIALSHSAYFHGMTFEQPEKRLGYRGAFLAVADMVAKRFDPLETLAMIEHDWHFTTLVELSMIERMLDRNDCNYVKLPNFHDETERFQATPHPCPHFAKDVDRRIAEPGPFMRDALYSTNPHFVKAKKFLEWAEMVRDNPLPEEACKGNGHACGIEEVLVPSYFKDIETLGFDAAHRQWGIWLLLNGGTFHRCVEHVGL